MVRPNRYSFASAADASNEVEALQTDVMRFMAILGLCLMAIFALVQSLPTHPQDDRPRMESEKQLEKELQGLMAQVESLHRHAQGLQTELQRTRAQITEKGIRNTVLEKVWQQSERMAEAKHQQLLSQLQENDQQVARLEQELAQQNRHLAELYEKVDQERLTLHQLRRELDKERKLKQQHESELETMREHLAALPQQGRASSPVDNESESLNSQQEGFSLRFHDIAALQNLVMKAEVGFYAIVGKQVWGIKLGGKAPRWRQVGDPGHYHHMSPVTVPGLFSHSFHAQVSARGRQDITWGVTLPARIRSRIEALMQDKKGGDLVIDAGGHVSINP